MCFSATANFVASGVIAAVGVATLLRVEQPRAMLFAAVPLLFALHQFTEGFVWLGVHDDIRSEAAGHMTFLFILYAQGILPFLMPLAVLLMEPPGTRRTIVAGLTILGGADAIYILYALLAYPSHVEVMHHSLHYDNQATATWEVASIYIIVTVGSLIASTHVVVRWFGLANLVGVVATLALAHWAFTSIWCLYAAVISVMLYWQFANRKINVDEPNHDLARGSEPSLA